ncbi:MAG: hypothetical protein M3P44_12230, partial [Actinomycetota bacterium]|nr:hypothetical protein [Actinomycetota bacterium]
MKRAPIVLSATVAGVAATLGFQAQIPAASTPNTGTAARAPSTSSGSSSAGTSASSATKTVTSAVASNQYGNVQLKVTIRN